MANTFEEFQAQQFEELQKLLTTIRSGSGNDDLIGQLSSDTRKASREFSNMQRHFIELAAMNVETKNRTNEYFIKISQALDSARIYLNTHKGNRGTRKGNERAEQARKIVALLSPYIENYEIERNATKEREAETLSTLPRDSVDRKLKIAKLQRSIGIANFVPKRPDFEPKPSRWKRFWGAVKHGLYTCVSVVSHLTIGLVGAVTNGPFTVSHFKEKAITNDLNLDYVPGGNGEVFEKIEPEKGPDDQAVIGDKRRAPITYEVPIPGDTKQAPTMTLCFDQAEEGSSKGIARIKNKENEKGSEMGHAFVKLEYTRIDPVTGKEQRYRTTFGFYPHEEFMTPAQCIAMGTDGLHVPGSLRDDGTHDFSTSMTYEVNNKKINQVLLAAQQYEKDGYNYMKRSCATFAHDMAQTAGINTEDILVEHDLSAPLSNTASVLALFVAPAASRLAEYQMANKGQEDAIDYQRFGQKKVGANDIRNLKKRELNIRLKGYIPSFGAESVRNNENFKVMSRKYENTDELQSNFDHANTWDIRLERISMEIQNFKTNMGAISEKRKIDISEQIQEFSTYVSSTLGELYDLKDKAFIGTEPIKGKKNAVKFISLTEQKAALERGAEILNDLTKNIQEIYRETFKNDVDFNIPFQHLMSTIQYLNQSFETQYVDFVTDRCLSIRNKTQAEKHIQYFKEMIGNNTERGTILAKFNAVKMCIRCGDNGVYSSPAELMAAVKVYGSMKTYVEATDRYHSLKEEKRKLTSEEKDFMKLNETRTATLKALANSEGQFFLKNEFTEDDLNRAFVDFPAMEDELEIETFDGCVPSKIMQGHILNRVFGDLAPKIKDDVKSLRDKMNKLFQENVTASPNTIKGTKQVIETKHKVRDEISKILTDKISDMLRNNQFTDKIFEKLLEKQIKIQRADRNNPEMMNYAKVRTVSEFGKLMLNEFLKPVVEDINKELKQGNEFAKEQEELFSDAIYYAFDEKAALCNGAKKFRDIIRDKVKLEKVDEVEEVIASEEEVINDNAIADEDRVNNAVTAITDEKRKTQYGLLMDIKSIAIGSIEFFTNPDASYNNDEKLPEAERKNNIRESLAKLVVVNTLIKELNENPKQIISGDITKQVPAQISALLQSDKTSKILDEIAKPDILRSIVDENNNKEDVEINPKKNELPASEMKLLGSFLMELKQASNALGKVDKEEQLNKSIIQEQSRSKIEEQKNEEIDNDKLNHSAFF